MTIIEVKVFLLFWNTLLCFPALTSIKLPWMTSKIFLTLLRVEGEQERCTAEFLLAVPRWENEACVKADGGS